jgi:Astacin (Peptidase family M12A)
LATTKIGYISGNTFQNKRVEYEVIDGLAVFEGDIILGTVDEMERTAKELEEQPFFAEGVVVSGEQFRWPWGIIPFVIDTQLPNPQRVTNAIRHWENNTPIRFVPKSLNEEYWVYFTVATGICASQVGKRVPHYRPGGVYYQSQPIFLDDNCNTADTIHEIGHAVGLWHEHSREDRDNFVRINWNNIVESAKHNFEQHITDGDDIGNYDYCSIMHYDRFAFCKEQQCPNPPCPCVGATIDVLQPNLPCANNIGLTPALSDGDVRTVRYIYGRLLTSGPGAVSWGPSRIDVFGRGKDNGLWHQWFDGTWHSWEYLGGGVRSPRELPVPYAGWHIPRPPERGLTSSPDVCSMGPNHLDVFVRGDDYGLWHRWFDRTTWYGWSPLGGYLESGPGAVSWGPGRIDVFAIYDANHLQRITFDGTWHNWEYILPTGPGLSSDPDVCSMGPNHLDVFVRGNDNALWHQWFDGTNWSAWQSLGGYLASGPGAVSWGPSRIDVFVRMVDNALWHRWFDGTWHNWESLGGTLTSSPDVCSMGPNHLDVFVRGTDGALWHQWFDGTTWSGWGSLF